MCKFLVVKDPKWTKLVSRSVKSIFVGYAEHSNGYRLLDLSSNVIVKSRDVEFIEDKFNNDSIENLVPTQIQGNDSNPNTT